MNLLEDVHFFTVELKDGHVMSTPRYEPAGEFIGSLIHEIESKKPEFAWFQLVFQSADHYSDLLSAKSVLSAYVKYADTPQQKTTWEGHQYEVERREKRTEWYRSVPTKVKKIDKIKSLPTVTMQISGMWVGSLEDLTSFATIANCTDEIDGLVVAPMHDPRNLVWLQQRRVAEPGKYLRDYGVKARKAAPSFVLTTKELPYYLNLPTGKIAEGIKSIRISRAQIADSEDSDSPPTQNEILSYNLKTKKAADIGGPLAVVTNDLPKIQKPFTGDELSRLRLLSASSRRSFEVVYDPTWDLGDTDKPTKVILWAENGRDLEAYKRLIFSVFGRINFTSAALLPNYITSTIPEELKPLVSTQGHTRSG